MDMKVGPPLRLLQPTAQGQRHRAAAFVAMVKTSARARAPSPPAIGAVLWRRVLVLPLPHSLDTATRASEAFPPLPPACLPQVGAQMQNHLQLTKCLRATFPKTSSSCLEFHGSWVKHPGRLRAKMALAHRLRAPNGLVSPRIRNWIRLVRDRSQNLHQEWMRPRAPPI